MHITPPTAKVAQATIGHWHCATDEARRNCEQRARLALATTGNPQTVHAHRAGEPCHYRSNFANCYTLQYAD